MHYKQWSSEKRDHKKQPPLQILEGLPSGIPSLIKPNYAAIEQKNLKIQSKCSEIGAFQNDDVEQWTEFLEEEKKKEEMQEEAELVD